MTFSRHVAALCCAVLLCTVAVADAARLATARRDIAQLRYEQAELKLVEIARSTQGEEKQEALFLIAGLRTSVSEAEMIYEEVIEIDPRSRWGERSQIELAKIKYAIGHYREALNILERSSACRGSDEACFFQGLSAVMLKRYDDAREPLGRVKGGSYQPWAYLALAEIDMERQDAQEACRKYRSMSRSGMSPTAMYRYGECLEKTGDNDEATSVFEKIVREFRDTPEAVLAGQKLKAFRDVPTRPILEPAEPAAERALTSGFTLQFGSFHDRENAIKLMAELKPYLPGVRIDSDLLNYKEIHRVRFGYFASRADAQRKANELAGQITESTTIMTLP